MTGRIFVDTNVLVYAHDLDAGRKNRIALELVSEFWENQNGILSTEIVEHQKNRYKYSQKTALPPDLRRQRNRYHPLRPTCGKYGAIKECEA